MVRSQCHPKPRLAALCQSGPAQILDRADPPTLSAVNRDQALRILVVISHPWDVRLGAPRVYMELADQWCAAGNVVEIFSLSHAFPGETGGGAKLLLRQFAFAYKAAAFIRENGDRFDVIHALVR